LRFHRAGPDGLLDGKAPGQPPLLERTRRPLPETIEREPIPAWHDVMRWRLIDLKQWLHDESGLSVSKQTLILWPVKNRRRKTASGGSGLCSWIYFPQIPAFPI
jgi:hypothetical protein